MPTASYGVSLSGFGTTISRSIGRTADGGASREVTLPVGAAGQLTTRTDNETGTITMASGGHGITTGAIVDLRWATGVRYGVLVGTVTGTSVPIGADDSGAGDNLPTNLTNLVVTIQVQINADIDGDELAILGIEAGYASPTSTAKAHVDFQESDDTSVAAMSLNANAPRVIDVDGGDSNIFAGDPITKIMASNGSSSEVCTLKLIWAADSTP